MADAQANTSGRDQIAETVVWWSGLGILVTTVTVLGATLYLKPEDFRGVAITVFNTLIPLFGTWVGTVLAFYFAGKNFDAAAKNTRDLVEQLGDERLKQIAVKDAWVPDNAIDGVTVSVGQEGNTNFADIKAKLSSKVSRVPIWNENKVVRFVIHQSMIFKFLAEQGETHAKAVQDAVNASATIPSTPAATLRDFLNLLSDGVKMESIVSKIAWVSQSATLADAKAKMEGTPNCQDVFVTESGNNDEPVLGWITNVDIAKKARA